MFKIIRQLIKNQVDLWGGWLKMISFGKHNFVSNIKKMWNKKNVFWKKCKIKKVRSKLDLIVVFWKLRGIKNVFDYNCVWSKWSLIKMKYDQNIVW